MNKIKPKKNIKKQNNLKMFWSLCSLNANTFLLENMKIDII